MSGRFGKVRKVVMPVAGLGTRGLPFTKEVPKEMLPVIDTPTVQFIVEEVLSAGIEQVILVTSKGKSVLEDFFDLSPNLEAWLKRRGKDALAEKIHKIGTMCEVITVRQKEPLGLGHAIYCARNIIQNESFAVCLGDEIFPQWDAKPGDSPALKHLVESATQVSESMVGVVEIPKEDSQSYGIVDVAGQTLTSSPHKVSRTVEKPKPEAAPSRYAIIGRYVFDPVLFDCLKEVKPGVGGELQLTDAMDMLARQGKLYAKKVEGLRFDIGNHVSYLKAQVEYALRRPEMAEKIRHYLRGLS